MFKCLVDLCDAPARTRGWCGKHYARFLRYGDPCFVARILSPELCTVDGCDLSASARGWCHKHYTRWRRHGDPIHREFIEDVEKRFWSKTARRSNGCIVWLADKTAHGYGRFGVGRNVILAHVWSYTRFVGPITDGLFIDHECHNGTRCKGGDGCKHRACVNPKHLKAKTRSENMRSSHLTGPHRRCPKGHLMTPKNLYRSEEH